MEHQFNKKGRHVNLVDGRIVSIRQTDVTSSDLQWTSSFQASALTIVKQIWHVTSPAVYLCFAVSLNSVQIYFNKILKPWVICCRVKLF